ncbi:MAG: oligosaccharide flippase family protein [Prevotella sp.]|nr:oligosaccharide flippase family protein [Candidatus Prevotella equi]
MQIAYKDILKATTLFGGVQGLNIIINLVRTKFVAMLLGPAGVGLNSIYNETRELIHETTNVGMDQSGVRDISKAFENLQNASDEAEILQCKEELKKYITLLRSWEIMLALFGMFITILLAEPLSMLTFDDKEHTLGYILLSPSVAFSTITCGEMVVLKALRKLKVIALLSTLHVLMALIVAIPIYYFYGISGVIPAILLFTLSTTILTAAYSYNSHKPVITWKWQDLNLGLPMLKLGGCFVITGIMNHGMELFINSYINKEANEVMVGLYRAGYTITGTYASLFFRAISADFYPRLSGIIDNPQKRNTTVCQQMEVLLMLVGPMTIALLVALPLLIPMLLSNDFIGVIPMTRITIFGVLFSAIYIPAAVLPLAAGDTKLFLLVETISTITMSLIIVGYSHSELVGAGMGKVISTFVDTIVILAIAFHYYKLRISRLHVNMIILHVSLLILTYILTEYLTGWAYWTSGTVMLCLSSIISWKFFKHKA